MSLSQRSLPSIDHVLEGESESATTNTSAQEDADASVEFGASSSRSRLPALISQSHLMKTMDLRDNDLENEATEIFSFVVGFPDDEAAPEDKDDAQTIFEEGREAAPREEMRQAPVRWLKINFAQWVMAIRRLFPVRFAEIFLRKAGQELAQR